MTHTNDPLIEALHEAGAGIAPSPFGCLEMTIPGSPASVQSKGHIRNAYIARIKEDLAKYKFILTGQLMLEIVWLVPAKSRYETDAKADIDNCLKPIIDAFTGPDGIFINDCQLKGLYICWRHTTSDNECLHFRFKFDADQWCEREGLAFIRLEKGLCCPVNTTWPQSVRKAWVDVVREGEQAQARLERVGVTYLALAAMTGGSQSFHATRTGGFQVMSAEDFVFGGNEET